MTKALNPDVKKQVDEALAALRDLPTAVTAVKTMADLQLRLATELQLWEAEHKAFRPPLVMLALISFVARIAAMDGVSKSVVLALIDNCTEWDEEPG